MEKDIVYDVYSLCKTDFGKVILAGNFAAGSGKGSAISGKTVKSISVKAVVFE